MIATDGSDEREFLHDLATPLGTAVFLIDVLLDGMQEPAAEEFAGLVSQAEQIHVALARVKSLLQARRNVLILRGVPGARSK